MSKPKLREDERRLLHLLRPLLRFRAVISALIVLAMLVVTIVNEHVTWPMFVCILFFLVAANYFSFVFIRKEFSVRLLLIMNGTLFTLAMSIGAHLTGGYKSPFLPGYILLIITTSILANSWIITFAQTFLVIVAADAVIILETFNVIDRRPFFLSVDFTLFGVSDPLYSIVLWNILYVISGALIGSISKVMGRVRSELNSAYTENIHLQNIVKSLVSKNTWTEANEAARQDTDRLHERHKEQTIVFTDIVGFSTIAESIKPEEVVAMLNLHFQQMGEIIYKHDGDIDKFIGDSIMAVFDDPMKAVAASIEMQLALKNNTITIKETDPLSKIRVRVGINTGDVVFGNMGMKERTERSLIGDAVNVAQRLQSMADPGYILISQSTYSKVRQGKLTFTPIGRVKIKGKKEIIRAYSINPEKNRPQKNIE